ncbi:MAG: VOC family protein [Rhodobacteraceae bacterium]|nr:VOC family protein [Paracoccaceae bacterium]
MTIETKAQLVPELACRDASVSRQFYVEILGFRVLYERLNHGFYYLERQGAEIMIEQLSDTSWIADTLEPPFGRGLHFQIETTELAKLYDICKINGVKIFREWEEAWYRAENHYVGQSQFIVCDPDGYMLRFVESLGKRLDPPEKGRVVS